jgi:hypothetical protein
MMPEPPELPLKGGCMCEAIRFEISEPLPGALYCHCKRCQRRTGTAFSLTALTVPLPRFPERLPAAGPPPA